jgi:hypothetical protein
MVSRRQVLVGTGLTFAVPVLAGCSSSSDSGGDEDDEESTPEPEERLETVDEKLSTAGDRLQERSNEFDGLEAGVSISADRIRSPLDEAESELDSIEDPTDDQQARMDEYRKLIRGTRAFVDMMVEFEAFLNGFREGMNRRTSGRYEDAKTELERISVHASNAADHLAAGKRAYGNVDASNLPNRSAEDIQEIVDGVSTVESAIEVLGPYNDASIQLLDGIITYLDGTEQYDAANYVDAESEFETARQQFQDAEGMYRNMEDDAPSSMQAAIVNLTCQSGAWEESAGLMVDAAVAERQGRTRDAQSTEQQAEEALNQCS